MINNIHTILTSNGIVTMTDRLSSKKDLAAVLLHAVPELAKLEPDVMVFLINSLNEGISPGWMTR